MNKHTLRLAVALLAAGLLGYLLGEHDGAPQEPRPQAPTAPESAAAMRPPALPAPTPPPVAQPPARPYETPAYGWRQPGDWSNRPPDRQSGNVQFRPSERAVRERPRYQPGYAPMPQPPETRLRAPARETWRGGRQEYAGIPPTMDPRFRPLERGALSNRWQGGYAAPSFPPRIASP